MKNVINNLGALVNSKSDNNRELKEEIKLFKNIVENKDTKDKFTDPNIKQRLTEKFWKILSTSDSKTLETWVEEWIAKNPANYVGTKNHSNREEWLKKKLKKVPKGHKMLDAGAGELQYKKYCNHLEYVSQDFGEYTGEGDVGLQQGTWDNSMLDIVSDIASIPVKDKSFDAIMCIEVFEHIPHPIEAIKEFSRIIKPGGELIIAAPFASFTHFAPYYFYNGYSRYFYEKVLPEYGFEIKEIYLNGNFFEGVAQEIRRIDQMVDKYVPSAKKSSPLDKLFMHWLLRRLEKLSAKDIGSNEFSVHDIGVVAVKK